MITMFVVTVNAPGFLPECEPAFYETESEARSGMVYALAETWGALNESDTESSDIPDNGLNEALDELAAAPLGKPVTVYLAGLAHCLGTCLTEPDEL